MSAANGAWVQRSGRGRHDIEVRQEQERVTAGAVAAQAGVDRATAWHGFDDLRLQAKGPQPVGQVLRGTGLAIGSTGGNRIDGWDPDQVLQGGDEVVMGGIPGRGRHLG